MIKFYKRFSFWVFVVATMGFLVRIWGIGFGLPHSYHADEPLALKFARGCWEGKFNPSSFGGWETLSGLHTYILFFFQKIFYFSGVLLGHYQFIESPTSFLGNSNTIYLLGRGISALLGTLTIPLVYLIGKILFFRKVGFIAALLFTFTLLHIESSHFITPDVPVTFFIVLSFLFATLIYTTGKIKFYILAAICAGLAFSTKYNGVFILVSSLVAHLCYTHKEGKNLLKSFFQRKVFILVLFTLVGVFLGCPYMLIDIKNFSREFIWQIMHQTRGHGPIYFKYGWLQFFKNIRYGLGIPLSILSLGGVILSLIRRNHQRLILVSFPFLYFLICSGSKIVAGRYLIIIYPFLCLLGADFLYTFTAKIFKRKDLALSLILPLILIFPVFQVLNSDYFFWQKDTRTLAEEWIKSNIPAGSKIALEAYCPWLSKEKYEIIQPSFALGFQPLKNYRKMGVEYLITSDYAHHRYIYSQRESYSEYITFYKSLNSECDLLKEFHLKPVGFSNPIIKIYKLTKTPPQVKLDYGGLFYLPSLKSSESDFYFLKGNPLFKNLSSFPLNRKRATTKIVVSPEKLDSLGIFLKNGTENNTIKVKIGLQKIKLNLYPQETKLIVVKPHFFFPYYKYLYRIKVFSSQDCSAAILTNPFEIGYTFLKLKDWDKAIENLEKTSAYYLLAIAYQNKGMFTQAIEQFAKVEKSRLYYGKKYYQLARGFKKEVWKEKFYQFTGINLEDWQKNNTIIYESENSPSLTGKEIFAKDASHKKAVYYEGGKDKQGYLVYGPYKKIPPGFYKATFRLKTDDHSSSQEIALLEVIARGSLFLGKRSLKSNDFQERNVYQDFSLDFYHQEEERDLEFRVYAKGKVDLYLDKVSISSDFPEWIKRKNILVWYSLGLAYEGENLWGKAEKEFKKVITLNPHFIEAHYHLALSYENRKLWDKAIEEYKKVLNYLPHHLDALTRLTDSYKEKGEFNKAELMQRRITAEFTPRHKREINFIDKVMFLGYDIEKKKVKRGNKFKIIYYWKCLTKLDKDYFAFVHFDGKNKSFQADHKLSTRKWKEGELIKEEQEITVSKDVSCLSLPDRQAGADREKGIYKIGIGIWDAEGSQERFKVLSTGLPVEKNKVEIGEIKIGN